LRRSAHDRAALGRHVKALGEPSLAQYHLPRAKPPKAIRPTRTMIRPIQKL
jgi:hypothetical protein